jgi:hypothetical protein
MCEQLGSSGKAERIYHHEGQEEHEGFRRVRFPHRSVFRVLRGVTLLMPKPDEPAMVIVDALLRAIRKTARGNRRYFAIAKM